METKHANSRWSRLADEETAPLAEAVLEDHGGGLTRAAFVDILLLMLEDVPGFEGAPASDEVLGKAWDGYRSHVNR